MGGGASSGTILRRRWAIHSTIDVLYMPRLSALWPTEIYHDMFLFGRYVTEYCRICSDEFDVWPQSDGRNLVTVAVCVCMLNWIFIACLLCVCFSFCVVVSVV